MVDCSATELDRFPASTFGAGRKSPGTDPADSQASLAGERSMSSEEILPSVAIFTSRPNSNEPNFRPTPARYHRASLNERIPVGNPLSKSTDHPPFEGSWEA